MEDISRATGSVAHLYKTLELGPRGSEATVKAKDYEGIFEKMVQETGSIQGGSGPSQASAPSQSAPQAPPVPDVDPLEEMLSVVQK